MTDIFVNMNDVAMTHFDNNDTKCIYLKKYKKGNNIAFIVNYQYHNKITDSRILYLEFVFGYFIEVNTRILRRKQCIDFNRYIPCI